MTEQTNNHDWTIPTVGGDSGEWGQILNDFFDGELDRQVVLEGTFANRPDPANSDIKLYLATDRRIVYFNQESSWQAVYGLGSDGNPVPGTTYFESASVVDAPTNDDDVARKNELDGKADQTHAGQHEDGGSDEIDVGGLSGVLSDAQTPQTEAVQDIVSGLLDSGGNISLNYDDNNDTLTIDTTALDQEEVEDAVASLVTAGNAITVNYDDGNDSLSIAVDESSLSFYDGTNITADVDNQQVSTNEQYITEQDLSTVSTSNREDWSLYHHDGTSSIPLSDGNSTTKRGYYFWDESNSAWRQIATDSDTVDGLHGDDFARITGDTFTGQVRIDTETAEDSLLELLTNVGAAVYPMIHLGGDSDNGVRFIQRPDESDELTIEHFTNGTGTEMLRLDEGGLRDLELLASDGFETYMSFEREGTEIADLDNNASNIRWDMFNNANYSIEDDETENQVRFSPQEPKIEIGESFDQGFTLEYDVPSEEAVLIMDDSSTGEDEIARFGIDGSIKLVGAESSGTSMPGTTDDGQIELFDDTDASDPSGRIQFQSNSTTFTINADAGNTYRDLGAYDKAHNNEPRRNYLNETDCYICGDVLEEGDFITEVVNQRRTVSGPNGKYDEIHTVPSCRECFIDGGN